jgi:hypothetical protein
MANELPLNKFVLQTTTSTSSMSPQLIYSTSLDVSTIVLSLQLTNKNLSDGATLDVMVQKSGSQSYSYLMKNAFIPQYETLNPLSGKLVLEQYDSLYIEGSTANFEDAVDIVGSYLQNANN